MTKLRLWGVSRLDDNDQALMLSFDRKPTNDEMLEIHERFWRADEPRDHTELLRSIRKYMMPGAVMPVPDQARHIVRWIDEALAQNRGESQS